MATATLGKYPVEIHFNPPIFAADSASSDIGGDT